jgi:glycosyltransferase involved in cell wall biosynthesis
MRTGARTGAADKEDYMASVDVAVPCYQYGRYLPGCVASVLSQGVDDVRILIIDNASADNSLDVARELAAADKRVSVVAHPTNLGLHASFNEGIDWASADYFILLCADDLLAPNCLKRAVAVMEERPDIVLTFGRELIITSDEPPILSDQPAGDVNWQILTGGELLERICRTGRPDYSVFIISNATAVVRTAAQKRVGHYRAELPHSSDLEIWLRFACLGSAAQTGLIQGIRRTHPVSRSASGIHNVHMWNVLYEAAFESFFAHEGASLPQGKRLHRIARRALAERAYWSSLATLLRGDADLSLELLKFAFTRCPRTMAVPPLGYLRRRDDTFSHFANLISQATRRMAGRVAPVRHCL